MVGESLKDEDCLTSSAHRTLMGAKINPVCLYVFAVFAVVYFVAYLLVSSKLPMAYLDFEPYYLQSRAIMEGNASPYQVRGTKLGAKLEPRYPLTYSILLTPLACLSLRSAEIIFLFINLVLLMVAILMLHREHLAHSRVRSLLFVCLLLVLYPVVHCLSVGQVGIIIFTLVTGSLYLLKREQHFVSSILLALAASIKVVPGLLLVVFFVHKQFKYCLYVIAAFISLQAATGFITEFHNTWYYWTEYFPGMTNIKQTFSWNQSVLGYVYRILKELHIELPMLNKWVGIVIIGGFSVTILFRHWFSSKKIGLLGEDFDGLYFEVCVMMMLINMASPLGYPHHYVWIFIPLAYILEGFDLVCIDKLDLILLVVAMLFLSFPIEILTFIKQGLGKALISGPTLFGAGLLLVELIRVRSKRVEAIAP